jgi:hypothetical protein
VSASSAQNLLDIYNKGDVKLVPDKEYANGNNWDRVFETYNDTIYGAPMGNRKNLKVLPDGSVVVSHEYRNFYTKFSPGGKFEKEFGFVNKHGKRFQKSKKIEGVIDGNKLFTQLDNVGNMQCCDFNGNYIKTLKLDYMTRQMIPLTDKKIAVVGWVIWKESIRDFVAIVDYDTNKEIVVWEHFTDGDIMLQGGGAMFNYAFPYGKQGIMGINTMPHTRNTGIESPKIATVNNTLVIAIPGTGEIRQYDLDGNFIMKDKIKWARKYIDVEEQKEIQKRAIEKYKKLRPRVNKGEYAEKNLRGLNKAIGKMEEDLENISKPIPVPLFASMIKDSDDNLLFFEFPKEAGKNQFNVWVYRSGGKFIGRSSFVCDDYDLSINPSKMVFHNGYLYALQKLKDTKGVPLRLVRFRLDN